MWRAGTCALLAGLALAAPARAAEPIMPLSEVHSGMRCTARSVIQGTTISTFDAEVLDVVDGNAAQGPRILIRVSGPAVDATGIGPGFSGSPLYCGDLLSPPRVAGAISEIIGDYGNKTVLATPIEEILGTPVSPPAGAQSRPGLLRLARPISSPLTFAGLPRQLAALVSSAARRAHRALLAAPPAPAARFPAQALVPGASVSTGLSSGDVALGAIGTVAYRDGDVVWAFGHSLDGAGRRSLLLQDAYVYGVIGNPVGGDLVTYKLAAPGHDVGLLSGDGPDAVVGTVGAPAPSIPVDVVARDADTGRVSTARSTIADETDVGLPAGSSPLRLVAPLAVAAVATEALAGAPASASGSLCVRVTVRESRHPLRFCNRYVTTGQLAEDAPPPLAAGMYADVDQALGLLDGANIGPLHVSRVQAVLDERRGLAQDFIRAARAPRRVRRGSYVPVRLRVRRVRGPERTVTVRLRVPRDLPSGPARLTIAGQALDGDRSADAGEILIEDLGGGSLADQAGSFGPSSLAALSRRFAAVGRYDGLRASFAAGARGHHRSITRQAFRDPSARIGGLATVRTRVVG